MISNIGYAITKVFTVLITWMCLRISADDMLISDVGNMLDQAALNVMESNFPHYRPSRSVKDKFDAMRDSMRSSGDKEKIFLENVIPMGRIEMTNPTDIKIFHMVDKDSGLVKTSDFPVIAVAENSQDSQNYNSFVKLYKVEDNAMIVYKTLQIYAPYRLERFTIDNEESAVNILAVGGMALNQENMDPKTKLSLFDTKDEFKTLFEMHMTVLAMKYVRTVDNYFFVVADKIAEFTTFITVIKYDATSKAFILHERFPVAVVSDMEAVKIGKDVYLVVSIYMDYFGNLQAKSLVFQYSSHFQSFRPHSQFDTAGARDIALFGNGLSQYLIIANEASGHKNAKVYGVNSFIYQINDGFQLEKITTVATLAARQVDFVSIPSCSSKNMILALDNSDSIDKMSAYLFDSDRLTAVHEPLSFFSFSSGSHNPTRFASFVFEKEVYVAVATDHKNMSNILKIQYEVQEVSSPLQKIISMISAELKEAWKELIKAGFLIAKANSMIHQAVNKSKEQDIKGMKNFLNDIQAKNTFIESLVIENGSILYENNGSIAKADWNKYNNDVKLAELESTLLIQNASINLAKIQMENAADVNKSVNLSGGYVFDSAKVSSVSMNGKLEVSTVNGHDTNFLINDIVMRNTSDMITGTKTFHLDVEFQSIDLYGKCNNLDLSQEAVTVNGDQIISSSKVEFDDWGFNDTLEINGTINGIDVRKDLLSINGNEYISGQKSFVDNLHVEKAVLKGRIDGINFTKFAEDLLLRNSNQSITGMKTFKSSLTANEDVKIDGLINDFDLYTFSKRAIILDKDWTSLQHSVAFMQPVHIKGNLTVSGRINSLAIPEDVLLTSGVQTISGRKSFYRGLGVVGNITASGTIDGKQTDDLVLTSKDQTITGRKAFALDTIMKRNVNIASGKKVNNVLLSQLKEEAVTISGKQNLTGKNHFVKVEFEGNEPEVQGFVDDVKLSFYDELFSKAVLLNGDQVLSGKCILTKAVSATRNITVTKTLNGFNLPEDFLHQNKDQKIPSTFTFDNSVNLNGKSTLIGNASGFDLEDISQRLVFIDRNAIVRGHKQFVDNVSVDGSLTCDKKINNLDLRKDLMLKNASQTFGSCEKSFKSVIVFNDVNVKGDVNVSQTVDEVDLSEFKHSTLVIDEDGLIVEKSNFIGNVSVKHIKFKVINNVSVDELLQDIVTLDGDQVVTAAKTFDRIKVDGSIKTNSTIDGVNLGKLNRSSVLRNGDFEINGKIRFKDIKLRHNLEVDGRIHGVSITSLSNDVILKQGDYNFTRNHTIDGQVTIKGDLTCVEVNGFHPAKDFALKNGQQVIEGKKKFNDDVLVKGGIAVNGSINGVFIRELNEDAVRKSKEQIIHGKKIFLSINSTKSISVSGDLNSVNLRELKRSAVSTKRDCFLKGPITFREGLILRESLITHGLVNKKNLSEVTEDAVTLSKNETILGHLTFKHAVSVAKDVSVSADVDVDGLLNGINLGLLGSDVLLTDGNQIVRGKKVFVNEVECADDISINGSLNGINLKDDIVVQGRTQNIFGKKSFMNGVIATSDMPVKDLVNGYDLSMLASDTLILNKNETQFVTGTKIFLEKAVCNKDIEANGRIDGMVISTGKLLDLYSDQSIQNPVVFSSSVDVNNDIMTENSSIAHRLADIDKRRVTLNTKQKIVQNLVFRTNLNARSDINVEGMVNDEDLARIVDPSDWQRGVQKQITRMESVKSSHCSAMDHVNRIFRAAVSEIGYFEDHQLFKHLQTDEMYHFSVDSDYFMVMSIIIDVDDPCTITKMFKWDINSEQFVAYSNVMPVGAKRFAFFKESGESYLFIATLGMSCSSADQSVLLKWNASSSRFEKYQTVNIKDGIDALTYNDGNGTRVVIANRYSSNIVSVASVEIWHWNGSHLVFGSKIESTNIDAIRTFTVGAERCIAIAVGYDVESTQGEQYSSLYSVISDRLVLSQKIYQYGMKDIVKFETNGNVYLVIAHYKESLAKDFRDGELSLRKFSEANKKFLEVFTFPIDDPHHIDTIEINGNIFVTVVSSFDSLNVLQYQQGQIFKELFKVHHVGLSKTSRFNVGQEMFLGLTAFMPSNLNYYQTRVKPDTKLLKLKVSGFHPSYKDAETLQCH